MSVLLRRTNIKNLNYFYVELITRPATYDGKVDLKKLNF